MLQHRVTLRNPSEAPETTSDRYGRDLLPASQSDAWRTWAAGVEVWAGRRDRTPQQLLEEGAVVFGQQVVWTVRKSVETLMQSGRLDPNVEIVQGDSVWRSKGPPVVRGGPDYGRSAIYYEIVTEIRE